MSYDLRLLDGVEAVFFYTNYLNHAEEGKSTDTLRAY